MNYVIEVKGLVDDHWRPRFADMNFVLTRDEQRGLTVLVSEAGTDQAQLHAVLKQIRDMGLELLRVQRRERDGSSGDGDL